MLCVAYSTWNPARRSARSQSRSLPAGSSGPPAGPRRLIRHALDNGDVALDGTCAACGGVPPVADLVVEPGPGWAPRPGKTDVVSAVLRAPHRLLTPVRSS